MMKLPRRQFLNLAAGAAALPAVSRMARAQAYPTRPVRLMIDMMRTVQGASRCSSGAGSARASPASVLKGLERPHRPVDLSHDRESSDKYP
ncbi:MAG: hypothetical protein WBX37_19565 [Pseudolabrys sp.]